MAKVKRVVKNSVPDWIRYCEGVKSNLELLFSRQIVQVSETFVSRISQIEKTLEVLQKKVDSNSNGYRVGQVEQAMREWDQKFQSAIREFNKCMARVDGAEAVALQSKKSLDQHIEETDPFILKNKLEAAKSEVTRIKADIERLAAQTGVLTQGACP